MNIILIGNIYIIYIYILNTINALKACPPHKGLRSIAYRPSVPNVSAPSSCWSKCLLTGILPVPDKYSYLVRNLSTQLPFQFHLIPSKVAFSLIYPCIMLQSCFQFPPCSLFLQACFCEVYK